MPTSTLGSTRTAPLVDRDGCHHLKSALRREWLETDGLGGYASSTMLLCPTRRYHGLLVATPPNSTKRHLFLSRFEETLVGEERSFDIGMARYPGTFSPQGHQSMVGFDLEPYPSFHYQIGKAEILREILMAHGQPTTLFRYRVAGQSRPVTLRLRPLVPFREAESLTFENMHVRRRVDRIANGIAVRPYPGLPALNLTVGGLPAEFQADPIWYRQIEYQADLERGYDGHEDQFSPGWFEIPLGLEGELWVAATLGEPVADPAALWAVESSRRREKFDVDCLEVQPVLEKTADHFLFTTPGGRTGVIAGYPWFGEWGRDTFLSLPGLLLARDRVEECGQALEAALPFMRDGLLPNIFGATPEDSHYGSADAALWFARAVRLYETAGGRLGRVRDVFYPALTALAERLFDGAGLGMKCDEFGLIAAGGAEHNATWMDARTADGPVTPRHGYAVELNALWYQLLSYLELLAKTFEDGAAARPFTRIRRKAWESFMDRFWLEDGEYLADVWRDGEPDRAVRPNMVIAAALEFSPLTRGKRCDVLRRAEDELLTPRGLRTLSPGHPDYCRHYRGSPDERDRAYHQGTVWPWLLGFFVEGSLRGHGPTPAVIQQMRELLDGFRPHLLEGGMLHVSEVFDGDPPHEPGGAPAQAWNTAELLRAYRLLDEAWR